jgi:hypothetical protein
MFCRQYPVVVFFVRHMAYYRGLLGIYDEITHRRDFWRSTCDAHLKLATVAWCNVFGSYKEVIRPVLLNQLAFRAQYEQWEAEARSIRKNC